MVKTTFRDLFYDPAYGGGIAVTSSSRPSSPAGPSSYWFGPDKLDTPLDQDEVGKLGTMLGSGSIVAMDENTCMVRAAWRLTRFFHKESCGQCTPCREGAGWLEKILQRIEAGRGREADLDLLARRLRQHRPGPHLASPADHDLPPRPVDPQPHRERRAHVPRRVPDPHQGRGVPLWRLSPRPRR